MSLPRMGPTTAFNESLLFHRAGITFESIEIVMATHLSEVGYDGFPSLSHPWESANSAPLFKGVFVYVANPVNAAFLLLKAHFIARFYAQGAANLHRNGDLSLAGALGSEALY